MVGISTVPESVLISKCTVYQLSGVTPRLGSSATQAFHESFVASSELAQRVGTLENTMQDQAAGRAILQVAPLAPHSSLF